jgi:UDPglucose--hexose-1-phosphate uridylyltransferase
LPEIRVDPLTGLRSIIAGDRASRPGGWAVGSTPAAPIDPSSDPFAPGNEDRTPPELFALRDGTPANGPGWKVRVVPNLYPALSDDGPEPPPSHDSDLFRATTARGAHEVVINAPDLVTSLGDLTPAQVADAMEVWRLRIRAHAEQAAYVHVLVNERLEGGASLPHTHAQLYALDFVPAQVAREREHFTAHATRTMGGNLLQDLVQEEVRMRDRLVAVDDEAVLLSPYAARLPYQLMLAPRTPRARFEDDGVLGARLLHDALNRLRRVLGVIPPLNLWVRTAPRGAEHFCWRIDIVPRLCQPAGLELGAGVQLCVVTPEQAAAELRDA